MRRKERIVILILIIATIIMGILLYNKTKQNDLDEGQAQVQNSQNDEEIVQQANTTYNNREKVIADKQLGQFKVTNISATGEGGLTTIRASIENTTGIVQNEFPITIDLKNEQNETIQTVHAYVGTMQAGETRSIVASVNMDVTQIYDITFQN